MRYLQYSNTKFDQLLQKSLLAICIYWSSFGSLAFCINSPLQSDTTNIKKLLNKVTEFRNISPDSAISYSQKALKLAQQSKNNTMISLALQSQGESFVQFENYGSASDCFLKALEIDEIRKNKPRIAVLSNNMGEIYYELERFRLSLDYFERALKLYTELSDSNGMAKVFVNIGNLHKSRLFCESRNSEERITDYQTAIEYYFKAEAICLKTGNMEHLMAAYMNAGNAYKRLENIPKAREYLQKAMDYYQSTQNPQDLIDVYFSMGLLYTLLKEYDTAIDYFGKSETISEKNNLKQGILYLYEQMAYTYDQAGKYKKARDYFVKYMVMRDSIFNLDKAKEIFELEAKYQTEKKEKEILKLSLEKKRRNFVVSLLAVILTFTLITSWYIIVRSRQKRMLAEKQATIKEQKIKELEQEKMLVATQSVLTGEELERRRLARDLHDGLGGLLSGIKLKLTNMKGNFILDENGKADFDKALEMLDGSVKELRQVAHNMMPEALIKFGLKAALGDYCSSLDSCKDVKIQFQFYGENKRVSQNIEIALYRIAQELINNALKHASASEILVFLVQDAERINLTIEDNGLGFDTSKIAEFKGMGLNSLKSRVNALNGIFDIMSSTGKGTEVKVEFPLN